MNADRLNIVSVNTATTAFCGVCGEIAECRHYDADLRAFVCREDIAPLIAAEIQIRASHHAAPIDLPANHPRGRSQNL